MAAPRTTCRECDEQIRTAKAIRDVAFESGRAAGFEYAARYILDRAEQYDESSGIYSALREVGCDVLLGEAKAAADCGELDDDAMGKDVAAIRRATRKAACR